MRGCIIKPKGRRKSWGVKLYLTDPQTGAKRPKWFSFPTRKEAEVHLSEILAKIHGGGTIPTTKLTVAQFLQQWLEKSAGTVRETSFASYRDIVNKHLSPALGQIMLRELTPLHIQSYFTAKLQGKTGKPLSAGTVRKHGAILHKVLEDAVKLGLLARNACDLTESPKLDRKEMKTWDEEPVQMFLAEAKRSSPYYPLYLTAICTGCRIGELAGLRWQDVDLTMGTMTIQQTLYRLNGRIIYGSPKSKKSRRTIPLLPALHEELRKLKAEYQRLRQEFGSGYHDLDEHGPLVFCQPDGKPLHVKNIVRWDYRRIQELRALRAELRAKGVAEDMLPKPLPRIRFHDLRHTTATHLLAQSENPKAVSELLGHSSVAFTMDVYGHVLPGRQAQMMARLQERLLGQKTTE